MSKKAGATKLPPYSPPPSECGSTATEPLFETSPFIIEICTATRAPVEGELYSLADLRDGFPTGWKLEHLGFFGRPLLKSTKQVVEHTISFKQQLHATSTYAFLDGFLSTSESISKHPLVVLCRSKEAAKTVHEWRPSTLRRVFDRSKVLLSPSDARTVLIATESEIEPVDLATLDMLCKDRETRNAPRSTQVEQEKILLHLLIKYLCFTRIPSPERTT